MAVNNESSPVSHNTKSFFGGVSGALGFIITIVLVGCGCCAVVIFLSWSVIDKFRKEYDKVQVTDNSISAGTSTTPIVAVIYQKGELAKAGDNAIKVFGVVDNQKSDNQFIKPKNGYKYYAVDVQVTYSGNRSLYVNQLDFKLKNPEGNIFSTSFVTIKTPDLAMVKLSKDESLRGWIIFEIPTDQNNLKLIYNPTLSTNSDIVVQL